jgi:hypothetical protein
MRTLYRYATPNARLLGRVVAMVPNIDLMPLVLEHLAEASEEAEAVSA